MNLFTLLTTALIALTATIFFYLRKKLSHWDEKNIKCLNPSILWGNLWGVGISVHLVHRLDEIYRKFVSNNLFCGLYYGHAPKLMILDLDLIKKILDDDFEIFHKRGLYYNDKDDPISCHLFHTDDKDQWSKLSNELSTIFVPKTMNEMMSEGFEICNLFNSKIGEFADNNQSFEAKNLCFRFSSDLISVTSLFLNTNAIVKGDSGFMKMAENVLNHNKWHRKLKYFFTNSYPDLSKFLGICENSDSKLQEYFTSTTQHTLQFRKVNSHLNRVDLLAMLQKIKTNDENISIRNTTVDDVTKQIFIYFLAGLDTLATTVSFALYELALNQNIQKKTREDIKLSLGKYNETMTYDAIESMEYLTQVIYETLRKYPPVHTIFRKSNKMYTPSSADPSIDVDTQILIPVYSIHHNDKLYPQPNVFNPERFCRDEIKKRHSASFLPFGVGPRKCAGQNWAILNVKMVLASLLLTYQFSVNLKTEIPIQFNPKNLKIDVKNGLWLNVTRI